MRIIGGKYKGMNIEAPRGLLSRPPLALIRESVFNILGEWVAGKSVLDLFAGTGSLGLEALSRGAASTLFIDIDKRAIATVRANLELTGLTSQADVQKVNAFIYLEKPAQRKFDYIYVAPPQYKGLWKKVLETLDNNMDWLTIDGWVITQIYPREFAPLELKNLIEFDRRTYGSTMLIFYQPLREENRSTELE